MIGLPNDFSRTSRRVSFPLGIEKYFADFALIQAAKERL